ncbi:hypothetical protein ONZ51_g4858 [Trametes cubensis]|uniref:P-loop containing nucleoside triphosphate hydrolase protein n=1 Tax=Trametes cubensis TaxID=1111947 RepID=A0AAD7TV39_9APHY|nr:hypothetical protein ONZ51_g4858 [Trametes cubensis]
MQALKNLLSPLSGNSNPIQDTLKLVVIGGTVETARRASVSAWNGFIDSFFLTAHFSQEDYPYDWLMHWLSKAGQPAWGRSREFDITTRSVSRHGITQKTTGDLEDENEDDEEESGEFHQGGGRRRKVAIVPSMDTTHTIYYRGHWLRITRTKRYEDYGSCAELKISVVARNNDILKRLVLEAKREYEKDAEHRVHIFMADTTYGCWRWNGARQKRPMSSIVLEPGVKDMILADCKDFLASEDWYAERGIPFRRGYLLHGVPGSGKTSLIHSLAGELGLDIYVVSLSSKGMSDNTLTTLMGNVPSRCILLLEDLDAAFTRGISRDETSTGAPTTTSSSSSSSSSAKNKDDNDGSTLSLSGLLNSLDGVAAAEGRLLFATTNHIERLDPALSRPGRMDVWVNFKHATKWQAEGIFKCFFPARPSNPVATSAAPPSAASADAKHPADATSSANLAESKRKHAIPENELSVAALQGYLLRNKTRPRECVDEVAAWVVSEREMREKLKKEKEEREAKEKKEAEEKAKKEKEEAEAKEREEKAAKEKTEKKESRVKGKRSALREAAKAPAASAPTENDTPTPSESTSATEGSSSAKESATSAESTSASESENTSGADADTEESVTSEEEPDKAEKALEPSEPAPDASAAGKEKWVSVKPQQSSADAPATA